MAVVVVTVMVIYLHRWGTTVGYFAAGTLELNGGVIDTKFLPQDDIYLLQDRRAL